MEIFAGLLEGRGNVSAKSCEVSKVFRTPDGVGEQPHKESFFLLGVDSVDATDHFRLEKRSRCTVVMHFGAFFPFHPLTLLPEFQVKYYGTSENKRLATNCRLISVK